MISVHLEYGVDKHQKRKAVLVPTDEWEQIVSELEWADCLMPHTIPHEGIML
jgi:hypothetical protein